MTDWQPIDSAPRDGTKVDLWVVQREARTLSELPGERIPDACWTEPTHAGADRNTPMWCKWDSPCWEEIERLYGGGAYVVTHWMPVPVGPSKIAANNGE
jgi:hypothetical protein